MKSLKFSCLFCFRSRLRNCIVTVWVISTTEMNGNVQINSTLISCTFSLPLWVRFSISPDRFPLLSICLKHPIYLLCRTLILRTKLEENSEHWVTNIHKSIFFSRMKAPSWTAYPGLNAEALRLQINIHLPLTHLSSNLVISLSYEQEEKSIFLCEFFESPLTILVGRNWLWSDQWCVKFF